MKFADKMKNYRQQHQWTQQDVADQLLVSRKTISSWENSRSYPDVFMLVQISDLYHVSLDDLLREDHEMIDSYKKEHLLNKKSNRIFRVSYLLNIIAVACSVLRLISPFKDLLDGKSSLAEFMAIFTLINVFVLYAHTDWQGLKHERGFWLTWLIIAVLKLSFVLSQEIVVNNVSHNLVGYVCGQITGIIISSFGLTCIIWLYSQFKERKDC